MAGVVLVGLQLPVLQNLQGLVQDLQLTEHAVDLEGQHAVAVLVGVGHVDELDDDVVAHAGLQHGFLTLAQAVEVHVALQGGNVVVSLEVGAVILVDLGIQSVADGLLLHLEVGEAFHVELLPQVLLDALKVHVGQQGAGTDGDGLDVLQDDLLQFLGEAALGLADHSLEEVHHGVGVGQGSAVGEDVVHGQVVLQHEDGQVAHHLGGGGHLDQVAQDQVGLTVQLLDLLELVLGAHLGNLSQQVGVLTAGDLVLVDLGVGCDLTALVGLVDLADVLVVTAQLVQTFKVQTGVALGAAEGFHHCVQRGLAGAACHGLDGQVGDVHAGLGSLQHGGNAGAGGVVGVQVDGDVQLGLEGFHQLLGGIGLQQAGHVLDGQDVNAQGLQFLGLLDVVVQGVLNLVGVQDVAGVAQGAFHDLASLQGLFDGHLHVFDPVQGVEDTEHVHALDGGDADELLHQVVGVVAVAHGVGGAQQHLDQGVGHSLAEDLQSLPGRFLQEAVSGVVGCAAPGFHGEGVLHDGVGGPGCAHDILGTHTGGDQGLLGVTHGGVGDIQLLLAHDLLGKALGAQLLELVLGAVDQSGLVVLGQDAVLEVGLVALGDVDDLVAQEVQNLGSPVQVVGQGEQLGGLLDEGGVAAARLEGGVVDHVNQEGDVGLDALDLNLPQGPAGLGHSAQEGPVEGADLHQQGVVVGQNLRAGVDVAAVQTDAVAGAGVVHADLAGVGHEVVGGVLGGDTGLDGVAVALNGLLGGDVDFLGVEGIALGDEDLGADDVHVGDQLGDGVLHLNPGVHFDEVGVALQVHQELAGAGVPVAHVAAQSQGAVEDLLAGSFGDREGGSVLNHLLVTALDGAVTVVQVDHVAVVIGQDLDLHVLGAPQVLFNKDLVVAEGLLGLVDGLLELLGHVCFLINNAHAAATAAVGGLQHHGVANLLGHFHGFLHGLHGVVHTRDNGHVGGDGDLLGGDLVAHGVHAVHGGADEGDAVLFALGYQVGILSQEAVAGVDGVHVVLLGDLDDGIDVQVSVHGALARVQGIGLVRQGAEHGVLILLGVDGNGGDAQLIQCAEHTNGDLTAVGHQDALERLDAYFTHK